MAIKNKEEFDKGYQAAIEAIKKLLEKGNNPEDAADNANNDLDNPNNPNNSGGDSMDNGQKSRTNKSDSNNGVVRPEDCIGPSELDNTPSTPGTMVDKQTGDKIAEAEGHDKEGSETQSELNWKDAAMKASKKAGNSAGNTVLKLKIDNLYKPAKDWKKELKKVVGYSISPEDMRQAYANKNVLITQNRIARTDKTKYDSVDYIIAFIDSSGSMSDEQLKICLSEVYQMALQKKPLKIYVIQCDTQIQMILEFNNIAALKKSIKNAVVKGRGGTDFKACWDLLKTDKRFKGRQAELVMIFTDGWCAQYKRDPRSMANLCWVILDNSSFNLQYNDVRTKAVYINTEDIK